MTGEDPEEIEATLHGQLESEIDPANVYQRAMVEGNLNKQTQDEIDAAVQRAKQAYEIATRSLFRDVSSYSFDNYQRELATDLTLADLAALYRALPGHAPPAGAAERRVCRVPRARGARAAWPARAAEPGHL